MNYRIRRPDVLLDKNFTISVFSQTMLMCLRHALFALVLCSASFDLLSQNLVRKNDCDDCKTIHIVACVSKNLDIRNFQFPNNSLDETQDHLSAKEILLAAKHTGVIMGDSLYDFGNEYQDYPPSERNQQGFRANIGYLQNNWSHKKYPKMEPLEHLTYMLKNIGRYPFNIWVLTMEITKEEYDAMESYWNSPRDPFDIKFNNCNMNVVKSLHKGLANSLSDDSGIRELFSIEQPAPSNPPVIPPNRWTLFVFRKCALLKSTCGPRKGQNPEWSVILTSGTSQTETAAREIETTCAMCADVLPDNPHAFVNTVKYENGQVASSENEDGVIKFNGGYNFFVPQSIDVEEGIPAGNSKITITYHVDLTTMETWEIYYGNTSSDKQYFLHYDYTKTSNSIEIESKRRQTIIPDHLISGFEFILTTSDVSANVKLSAIFTNCTEENNQQSQRLAATTITHTNNLDIYPVPFRSEFTVESETDINEFEIYNAYNRSMPRKFVLLNSKKIVVSTNDYPEGIYFFSYKGIIKKIVK